MRIYFDHNATTPVDPSAADVMMRVLRDEYGNASSVHRLGQQAKSVMDEARSAVSSLIGAEPSELVFTSGGTEADNFALRGAAEALEPTGRKHLIATSIEHEAGIVSPDALRDALTDDTAIVSVMHANNELGTIQPVAELAAIARSKGALVHTDAVQSVAKIPVNVRELGVDLLSLSAHKFNGPKGAGALWIKRGTRIVPILTGGKHERTRRAGTENVPAIAGMGAAAEQGRAKLGTEAARVAALRDRLEREVLSRIPGTVVNGARERRVPNTTNISFERIEAESLLIALDLEGIAVSTGAACSSGTLEPSHVLRAMGLPTHRAQNSIRFSLGAGNTDAEIDYLLEKLPRAVEKLRSLTGARR
jgi:cysteine desulfurase